jgi:hypothetical protein
MRMPVALSISTMSGDQVRSLEYMSVLMSSLPQPGEWAVIEWSGGAVRRWCQTMRHLTGWIVDAHDGAPDDFARRVYRRAAGDYPKPTGRRPAFDFELWQPFAAADVIWSWLHGSLPEGVLAHHAPHDQSGVDRRCPVGQIGVEGTDRP